MKIKFLDYEIKEALNETLKGWDLYENSLHRII